MNRPTEWHIHQITFTNLQDPLRNREICAVSCLLLCHQLLRHLARTIPRSSYPAIRMEKHYCLRSAYYTGLRQGISRQSTASMMDSPVTIYPNLSARLSCSFSTLERVENKLLQRQTLLPHTMGRNAAIQDKARQDWPKLKALHLLIKR